MAKFLKGKEAFQYLCSKSRYDVETCESAITTSVFPSKDFIIYNYDFTYQFNLLTVVRVIDIFIDTWGVNVSFMDRLTSHIFHINAVPTAVAGYDVFASVPHKVFIERTLREDTSGQDREPFKSIASSITLYHRTKEKIATAHDYMMPVVLARQVDLGEGMFEQACNDKGIVFEY